MRSSAVELASADCSQRLQTVWHFGAIDGREDHDPRVPQTPRRGL
jgi:hypothetical protein